MIYTEKYNIYYYQFKLHALSSKLLFKNLLSTTQPFTYSHDNYRFGFQRSKNIIFDGLYRRERYICNIYITSFENILFLITVENKVKYVVLILEREKCLKGPNFK